MTHDEWVERALARFREEAELERITEMRRRSHQHASAVDLYCRVDEYRRSANSKPFNYSDYEDKWQQVRWSLNRFAQAYGFKPADDEETL